MKIRVVYYALLRQERGLSEEILDCQAEIVEIFFDELKARHSFSLARDQVRVAVNGKVSPWGARLKEGDTVLLMPPVAGG